jgi:hypothetical protein
MTTNFTLTYEGKIHELEAQCIERSETLERWRIWCRGDQNRFLTLTNDRPRLQTIHLYRAPYKWTIEEGDVVYRKMFSQITTYLEYYIKGLWKSPRKEKVFVPDNGLQQAKLF